MDEEAAIIVNSDVEQNGFAELWHDVGTDHREHLKLSEALTRNLTQFFLGVGKVLREATTHSLEQSLAA